MLTDHFKQPQTDIVLLQSKKLRVDDAAFRAAIDDVFRAVGAMKQVGDVRSPLTRGSDGDISKDRHSARMVVQLRTTDPDPSDSPRRAGGEAPAAAAARHPGVAIEEFGANSLKQFNDAVASDLARAGEISLPITLIVLVIARGALVAAGFPPLLALTSVVATMGLLALPSHLLTLDQQVSVIVLLIGLAVGVDYAMFYLKREREERAAGRSERAALEAAAATSGRPPGQISMALDRPRNPGPSVWAILGSNQ